MDLPTGASAEFDVNLTTGAITRHEPLRTGEEPYGQPQFLFEEYALVEQVVKADERWQAAMARRGITDTRFCMVNPLAPGWFPREGEEGKRVINSLTYWREKAGDNPWGHPIEGLITRVDLTEGVVTEIIDEGDIPVPRQNDNYKPEDIPPRTTLKPLVITQPDGPSFQVDGNHVTWENWKMRIGFNQQEGLVLHQVSFRDGDEDRSVIYRASVPEMVVPYGDIEPTRYWISYFDAGEYHLGKNANSLKLGCDCLGVIKYFDATIADDNGDPTTIEHAVCMHEEDYGIGWKHTEFGERTESRRSRRLVISYFATIGNYDYGFFYYFYLDGSIEVEAKATGIVFVGASHPGTETIYAPEIAPGIIAPVHQHIFCARFDMAIDGFDNTVEEENIVRLPTGPQNPYGNAFTVERTKVTRESEGVRDTNSETGRKWYVTNPNRLNRVGKPTSYVLLPEPQPRLLAQEGSSAANRARFAQHHMWVTAFDADEVFPAGKYPNQNSGDGIARWVEADRPVENTDVVIWHTFGPTHVPRPEDWPVMPVDYYGFWIKPYGFLDQNPALDVPDWSRTADRGGSVKVGEDAPTGSSGCCSTDAPAAEATCCSTGSATHEHDGAHE